jgi:alkylhydroperoxidase/carboxymuconolactone decarboxylase family protein YurZ
MSTDPDDARVRLAQETMHDIFGIEWNIGVREGEPPAAADLGRILLEHAFADSWSRPGLAPRDKSLITMAIAVALGSTTELRNHVAGARRIGITPEEIVELLIHTAAYCGAARTSAAWSAARPLLVDRVDDAG